MTHWLGSDSGCLKGTEGCFHTIEQMSEFTIPEKWVCLVYRCSLGKSRLCNFPEEQSVTIIISFHLPQIWPVEAPKLASVSFWHVLILLWTLLYFLEMLQPHLSLLVPWNQLFCNKSSFLLVEKSRCSQGLSVNRTRKYMYLYIPLPSFLPVFLSPYLPI